jgi:hypothetical protein
VLDEGSVSRFGRQVERVLSHAAASDGKPLPILEKGRSSKLVYATGNLLEYPAGKYAGNKVLSAAA